MKSITAVIGGAIAGVAIVCAAPVSALAQSKATLEYAVPQGLSYSFSETQAMQSQLTLSLATGQSMPVTQMVQSQVAGTVTVLAVENGKPVRVQMNFAPDSGTVVTMNGAPTPAAFPLAGQEAIVTIRNEDVVSVERPGAGPVQLESTDLDFIRSAVVLEDALLPGRAVGVGDRWDTTLHPAGGNNEIQLQLAVSGFGNGGGRAQVGLQANGSMRSVEDGTTVTGTVTSSHLVDLATGIPVQSEVSGPVQISGSTVMQGQTVQINGYGQIASQQVITLGGGAPQATPRMAQPAQPAQPQRPAPNPRAQQPSGGGDQRLVGAFKGESIASGDGVYVNTQLVWIFEPNGRAYYGSQAHFAASERDYNGDLDWSATGRSDESGDYGRWSTNGNILTIQWDDGDTSRFKYSFYTNGELVFRNPNTDKLINLFPRVR